MLPAAFVFCLSVLPPGGSIQAQCVAPPGPYEMFIDPPSVPAINCPNQSMTFRVIADGGAASISAFGFNIEIGCPGQITSVTDLSNPPLGGFIFEVGPAGNTLAALGITTVPAATPLTDLVEVTFEPDPTVATGTYPIDFGGNLAFPGGFIPLDHLV